jgi:hypothetical protein
MLEKTEWQEPERIILQVFSGDVSLADMERAWTEVLALIEADSGKLPIHLILDFSQRKRYDPEMFKLPAMRQLFERGTSTERLGWFIVIQASPNPIMLFTSTLAARLTGRKFRVVASQEDALRYLYYTDSSLIKEEKP